MEKNDENTPQETPSPTAHLEEVLQTLDKNIEKQNSLKYSFIKGAIYGLGTVIGATVLVALLGGIAAATLSTFKIDISGDSELLP